MEIVIQMINFYIVKAIRHIVKFQAIILPFFALKGDNSIGEIIAEAHVLWR